MVSLGKDTSAARDNCLLLAIRDREGGQTPRVASDTLNTHTNRVQDKAQAKVSVALQRCHKCFETL